MAEYRVRAFAPPIPGFWTLGDFISYEQGGFERPVLTAQFANGSFVYADWSFSNKHNADQLEMHLRREGISCRTSKL